MTDDDRTSPTDPDDVFAGPLVDLPLRVPRPFMELVDNVAQGGNLPPEALGLALLWIGLQHAEEVGPIVMGVQMSMALQRGHLLAQLEAADAAAAGEGTLAGVGGHTDDLTASGEWDNRRAAVHAAVSVGGVHHFVIARDLPDADRYGNWLRATLDPGEPHITTVGWGQGDFLLRGRGSGIIHLVPGWDTRKDTIELASTVSILAESPRVVVVR